MKQDASSAKDEMFREFIREHYRPVIAEYKDKSREGSTPKTWWLPKESIRKYEAVQKRTKKQFGKDMKRLMALFIDFMDEATADSNDHQSA